MGKDKNIICTTEQLEEFLQQRNDIILDELKTILQQNSKNTDKNMSVLKTEVEGALKMREKELRRLRRETEECFRTSERLLHTLTFQRKMLEAVLKIRDREIQSLRRCVGVQKRLIVKTLNVIVADGVLEMNPKQRGELLKLVQEMGDIDIHDNQGVGLSEESVLQEYKEALISSERNLNTQAIDNVIQARRDERVSKQSETATKPVAGNVFTRSNTVQIRDDDSDTDSEYIPLDIKGIPVRPPPPTAQSSSVNTLQRGGSMQLYEDLDVRKRKEIVPKPVLFECAKLLGSGWVSFAISQRVGFTLDDVAVLRKRYQTDEERGKAMLLIWAEQSGENNYGTLFGGLCDIGRQDIAKKLADK